MLNFVLAVIAGFALLVWGADRFVLGSAAFARNLGVSTLVIGLTIVGFGTSAPEILVSLMASLAGNPGLAVGNAIGSNIANIGLILGTTALVVPLTVRSETLRREMPILFVIMLITLVLIADRELGRMDGAILLASLIGIMAWVVRLGLSSRKNDPMLTEYSDEIRDDMSTPLAVMWLVIGLIVLLASSRLLVWGAVNIAVALGVSDLIIGLTIVALGTSLPELAASVIAGLKQEHDIAIGNVLGSNLFNLMAVMGLPGLIHPMVISREVLSRDYPVMIGLTLLFFMLAYGLTGPGRIGRMSGAVLLTTYISYQAFIVYGMLAA